MVSQDACSRRRFLRTSAFGASVLFLPGRVLGLDGKTPPNGKLNVACIGVGGRGGAAVKGCSRENLVAFCDVDDKRAADLHKQFSQVPRYRDYRKMLEEKGKEIDAVTVSTPDHSHFACALLAMQMGKHVCVEKPLVHTVRQAWDLMAAAEKHKVVTQMGNQGHCSEGPRLVREWHAAGVLGAVRRIEAWTDRPIWPQGMTSLPAAEPVPEHLDWSLWLAGVADYGYSSAFVPFKWRGWYAFGTGAIGDFACHNLTAAYYALDLDMPTRVIAETTGVSTVAFPTASTVTFEFPARGEMPPVTLVWYDGKRKPQPPPGWEEGRKMAGTGAFIHGDKAVVMANSHSTSVRIVPEATMKELTSSLPPKTLPRIRGDHFANWIRACKGEEEAGSPFSYAGRLTAMALLGVIAQRLPGQELLWDHANRRFSNSEAGNRLLETALV
ncbi:MAG: Gfo/Idh/MocA family oxidoreductase [Lentisphaeria bacterium]|nr:Gfo/Idh/MocA family oxidoreductase [Lentisphaeria bacterium]